MYESRNMEKEEQREMRGEGKERREKSTRIK